MKGCTCIDNEDDQALLEEWVDVPGGPPEIHEDYRFDLLRDKILLEAREACQDEAEGIGPFPRLAFDTLLRHFGARICACLAPESAAEPAPLARDYAHSPRDASRTPSAT